MGFGVGHMPAHLPNTQKQLLTGLKALHFGLFLGLRSDHRCLGVDSTNPYNSMPTTQRLCTDMLVLSSDTPMILR